MTLAGVNLAEFRANFHRAVRSIPKPRAHPAKM